jgi:hypothetical protein
MWNNLKKNGRVRQSPTVPEQKHDNKKSLSEAFENMKKDWKEEKDMYVDVNTALEGNFYNYPNAPFVVDTSSSGPKDFNPDTSISKFKDNRLPHALFYYIEWKLPACSLTAPAILGQVLEYFHALRERQPYRSEFVAVLSNVVTAFVMTAKYDPDAFVVNLQATETIADAIIFADKESRQQFIEHIPKIPEGFSSQFSVLRISRHHALLSVPQPNSTILGWRDPCRSPKSPTFVLKASRDRDVSSEVTILKEIKKSPCLHLPELVWSSRGNKQLGIVPCGKPIQSQRPFTISRGIVIGLMDGLKHLHDLGIVHRDIRLSNLILDTKDNVVIIDYETAIQLRDHQEVEYDGGYICWPKQLLESNTTLYIPEPADDLLASILVVLHLIFPACFDSFHSSNVNIDHSCTKETKQLLALWNNIGQSKIWGPFAEAAKAGNYTKLKDMGDVFCHF